MPRFGVARTWAPRVILPRRFTATQPGDLTEQERGQVNKNGANKNGARFTYSAMDERSWSMSRGTGDLGFRYRPKAVATQRALLLQNGLNLFREVNLTQFLMLSHAAVLALL